MGVDVDALFMYGYKVNFNDIPDGKRRLDADFDDCFDEYVGYDEQDWYIGVGLPSDSTIEELFDACRESREAVKIMYEMVMRKPPTEEPRVHVYARWW